MQVRSIERLTTVAFSLHDQPKNLAVSTSLTDGLRAWRRIDFGQALYDESLSSGRKTNVLRQLRSADYQLLYSVALLTELADVLARPRLRDKYGLSSDRLYRWQRDFTWEPRASGAGLARNSMGADESPVFVGTNVLVYAFDQSAGEKRDRARSLLDQLWSDMRGCVSVQVPQEFYVVVTQKVQRPLALDTAAEIVRDLSYRHLHAPVAEDVLGAIGLQQCYMTSFWGAMILWSAQQLGCDTVRSEDLGEGREYNDVKVVNPFRE